LAGLRETPQRAAQTEPAMRSTSEAMPIEVARVPTSPDALLPE
jgi:hypothetical protein